MLRQELQQTRETLAAREAELAEMQSRIAELEKLQGDQSQLLAMKNTELAAAQQRLATAQQATPPPVDAARNTVLPWIWGGAALLLALLAGWAWRRRSTAVPAFRAPPATPRPSLADAFAPAAFVPGTDEAPPPTPAPATTAAAEPESGLAGEDGPVPFWDRRESQPRPAGRESPAPAAAHGSSPGWHEAKPSAAAEQRAVAAATAAVVPGQERLDLARAYLDLGDHVSARLLLAEVEGGGDAEHSQQATRMLREIE